MEHDLKAMDVKTKEIETLHNEVYQMVQVGFLQKLFMHDCYVLYPFI